MNTDLEAALVAYLTTALAGLSPAPVVRPAATNEILPTAAQLITAAVHDPVRVVGPLYDVLSQITVETPVVAGLTVAMHGNAVNAVEACFRENPFDTRLTAALSAQGWGNNGNWTDAPRDLHSPQAWKTTVPVKLGVERL